MEGKDRGVTVDMMRTKKERTFISKIGARAAKLNTETHLSKLTLAHVLASDTCTPISLADLEAYLIHKEHSVESLHFIVWFQDYRERFFKLPAAIQELNDGSPTFEFNHPNVVLTERRAAESIAKLAQRHSSNSVSITSSALLAPHAENRASHLPSPTSSSTLNPSNTESSPPTHSGATLSDVAPARSSHASLVSCEQSYSEPGFAFSASTRRAGASHPPGRSSDPLYSIRTECMNALATFLCPGAPKQLLLDGTVRDTAIRNLAYNYHPDVFQPVYEETYDLLEKTIFPRFIVAASANINRPRQLLWYIVGAFYLFIGILAALSLIMMVPVPPLYNRAWRLIPILFSFIGSVGVYAAWRGFCGLVFMHGSIQMRPWEMQEMDEEAKLVVDNILQGAMEGPASPRKCQPSGTQGSFITTPEGTEDIPKNTRYLRSHRSYSPGDLHAEFNMARGGPVTAVLSNSGSKSLDQSEAPRIDVKCTASRPHSMSANDIKLVAPWLTLAPEDDLSNLPSKSAAIGSLPHMPIAGIPDINDRSKIDKEPLSKTRFKALRRFIGFTPSLTPLPCEGNESSANVDSSVRPTGTPTAMPLHDLNPVQAAPHPNLKRPAVFGPERPVLDPRIKKLHSEIQLAILKFALCYTLVFGIVVLSVPARLHEFTVYQTP